MAKKSLTKSNIGGRELPVKAEPAKTPMATAKSGNGESTTVKPVLTKPVAAPTREEIARRAYEIYMGRGQAPGREMEDWAQAERELRFEAHRNN